MGREEKMIYLIPIVYA